MKKVFIVLLLFQIINLTASEFKNKSYNILKNEYQKQLSRHNLKKAKEILDLMEKKFKGNEKIEGEIKLLKADYYQLIGDYSTSLKYRKLALPYVENSKNKMSLLRQKINLSVIYFNLGKREEGEKLLEQCGKLIERINKKTLNKDELKDFENLKKIYLSNKATSLLKKGKYLEAYNLYKTLLELFPEKRGKLYIQTILNTAKCLMRLNDNRKEIEALLQEAIKGSRKYPKLHLYAMLGKAEHLIETGKYKNAEKLLKEIEKQALSKHQYFILQDTYKLFLILSIKQKNEKKALLNLEKFIKTMQRVFDDKTAKSLARLKKEITTIQMENRIRELQIKSKAQRKAILILLVSSLAILTLLLVIYGLYRKKMELTKKLEKLSTTDPLTGLLNRRAAKKIMETERQKITRRKDKEFSIALCDIDFFKKINDTYGHKAGDEVLKTVAKILKDETREYDSVARWGGEEFLLFFPETRLEEAVNIIERIREKIKKQTVLFQGKPIKFTMSFGVCSSKYSSEIEEIINKADKALYFSKHEGRDKISVYPNCQKGYS